MAEIIEKVPAPRNAPTSNLNDEWGFFVIYSDGWTAFEKANISDKDKIHALKNIYLLSEDES